MLVFDDMINRRELKQLLIPLVVVYILRQNSRICIDTEEQTHKVKDIQKQYEGTQDWREKRTNENIDD